MLCGYWRRRYVLTLYHVSASYLFFFGAQSLMSETFVTNGQSTDPPHFRSQATTTTPTLPTHTPTTLLLLPTPTGMPTLTETTHRPLLKLTSHRRLTTTRRPGLKPSTTTGTSGSRPERLRGWRGSKPIVSNLLATMSPLPVSLKHLLLGPSS
jgi:hypothetical protein